MKPKFLDNISAVSPDGRGMSGKIQRQDTEVISHDFLERSAQQLGRDIFDYLEVDRIA